MADRISLPFCAEIDLVDPTTALNQATFVPEFERVWRSRTVDGKGYSRAEGFMTVTVLSDTHPELALTMESGLLIADGTVPNQSSRGVLSAAGQGFPSVYVGQQRYVSQHLRFTDLFSSAELNLYVHGDIAIGPQPDRLIKLRIDASLVVGRFLFPANKNHRRSR